MKLSLIGCLPFLLVAACAASPDDARSSANDVVVNPSGTDDPGSIMFALTPGISSALVHTLQIDGKTVSSEAVIGSLATGAHTVSLNGCSQQVQVTANQTTTITLGAVTFVLPTEPTFGLTVQPAPWGGAVSSAFHLETCTGAQVLPVAGQSYALFPGAFSVGWGFGDGTPSFTIQSGTTTTVDLGAPTGRRLVRLHAPRNRAFPSVTKSPDYAGGNGVDQWTFYDSAQPSPYAPGLTANAGSTLVIGTRAAGRTISLALPFATVKHALALAEDAIGDQNIARIDVGAVEISGSNGPRASDGPWSLSAQDPSIAFDFALAGVGGTETEKGVDVWPGTYTVMTQYDTVEAGWKTTSQTVDAEN